MILIRDQISRDVDCKLMATECRKRGCKVLIHDGRMIVPDACDHDCRREMIAWIKGFFSKEAKDE